MESPKLEETTSNKLHFKFVEKILNDVTEFTQKIDTTPFENILRSQLHLQNLWILSHVLTLVGTSLYAYSVFANDAELFPDSYKISTYGSLLTYLVVLYRFGFGSEISGTFVDEDDKTDAFIKPKSMGFTEFIKNENSQLLGFVLLWLFTPQSIFKIVPFFLYSLLNLSNFFIFEVSANSSLSLALAPLLNYLEVPVLIIASYFDLIVFGIILRDSYQSTSYYQWIIYSFIWTLKLESSEASRSSIGLLISLSDYQILQDHVPVFIREIYWNIRVRTEFIAPLDIRSKLSYSSGLDDDDDQSTVVG